MTAFGGMGNEASKFYFRLSESIAEKCKVRHSVIKIGCHGKYSACQFVFVRVREVGYQSTS